MKTGLFRRLQSALLLVWAVILSGCTFSAPPPLPTHPFSCASFTDSRWSEFTYGMDGPADVISTVARLWEIEREQIQVNLTLRGDEVWNLQWSSIGTIGLFGEYRAWFQDNQKLAKISVKWGNPRPTLSQILDCLGNPDSYYAFYTRFEVTHLNLVLIYADRGIVIRHSSIVRSSEPARLYPAMRMDRFIVVPPGAAERVITDMYSYGFEVRFHVNAVCLLEPWPSSIDELEISSDEERIQCGVFPKS